MQFDWNKLDGYKVAIDDGFEYNKIELNGEINIWTSYGMYRFVFVYPKGGEVEISEKDWETFKKKVADYFLGN